MTFVDVFLSFTCFSILLMSQRAYNCTVDLETDQFMRRGHMEYALRRKIPNTTGMSYIGYVVGHVPLPLY